VDGCRGKNCDNLFLLGKIKHMRIDQAPEGGKFRATAAAALDGTAGAWGDADMLCVQFDGSGDIVVAAAGDNCDGVIWTKEGRKSVTDDNKVIGGRKYTVFTFAELVEAEIGASPALSEGDTVYATALGDVTINAFGVAGDIYIGTVLKGGSRLVVNVNGRPPHA